MKADLHIHTNASDGKFTIEEVIEKAKKANLDVISITDHDCFDSALKAINRTDIEVILGIELSTTLNGESIHILGYFNSDADLENLNIVLENQLVNRRKRAFKIIEKLDKLYNIKLDLNEFIDIKSITRGSICRAIINQGYHYDQKIIFGQMIGAGCPAYIPSTKISSKEGIDLIHSANGLAVIAHPMDIKKNNIENIIKLGIDGIEAIYPHQEEKREKYCHIAKKHNLFITAGSDFHTINEIKHGNLGDVYLTGKDLEKFLMVLYERKKTSSRSN